MAKARQSALKNPLDQPKRTVYERAASFVQANQHARYFEVGGKLKDGWVMHWCMRKLDRLEELPMAWKPSQIRSERAESFAWQGGMCESDYPADHQS